MARILADFMPSKWLIPRCGLMGLGSGSLPINIRMRPSSSEVSVSVSVLVSVFSTVPGAGG